MAGQVNGHMKMDEAVEAVHSFASGMDRNRIYFKTIIFKRRLQMEGRSEAEFCRKLRGPEFVIERDRAKIGLLK